MKNQIEKPDLKYVNLAHAGEKIHYQLTPAELIERAIIKGEGKLADSGALAIDTGEFTGRSPKDRFIVCDDVTENAVFWGDVNIKFESGNFDKLYEKITKYLADKEIYVRDGYACAEPEYQLGVRVVTEFAFQNLFAYNMFMRPKQTDAKKQPEWTIIAAPGFYADPSQDGTRQKNFAVLNFTKKMILIGGTAYTGEIKKGIFSALNFILPHQKQVLSMHCSANIGQKGDTAVFFGLSGTGKTTLSADPNRNLIGDDEHGWSKNTVFNFEGGCYAKCVDLSAEKEPEIFGAIKYGSLLENINFKPGTREVDFGDISKTENTRVSYPLNYIGNAVEPSVGGLPKNIFFLTADAFGVLPPISKLTPGQAMYYFLLGYTAKVAGTEVGVTEPQATFSTCFGKAFMPLHPTKYAELLGHKIKEHSVNVWLINTGWSGGEYGTGSRIKLSYTRAMITSALSHELDKADFVTHPIFGLQMPSKCTDVPTEILNPKNTWKDAAAYDAKAKHLAELFVKNFQQFESYANAEIMAAAPKA